VVFALLIRSNMTLAHWLEELRDDAKSGLRQLATSWIFAVVAVLTLALGIGANAAIFTAVKSVLVDALPYADADNLVRVYGRLVESGQSRGPLSAGTATDFAAQQRSFSSMAAFMDLSIDAVYGGDDGPQMAKMVWVDTAFFETLGVPAARGRTFQPADGVSGLIPLSGGQLVPDEPAAVVLTDGAWTRLFGNDPSVLGRDVRVNGIPRHVIGVLPPGFIGPMGDADFYFAFDLDPVLANPVVVRRSQWLGLIGRLKPGVTQDIAQREIAALWEGIAREHPADNGGLGIASMPLRDAMVGDMRTPLMVLMASAGLVLVITCANLAGALLSRTLSRRREFAVRAALGAGRARLVRQLLTESTLLALAGGAIGLLLAGLVLDALRDLALPALPTHADLSLDWTAVLVIATVAVLTGLAFGIGPALSVDQSAAQGSLRAETRGASESRRSRRLRGALVAAQMALCVSLLAGAGLLARSLWAMTTASLGFSADGVVVGAVQLPAREYATSESRADFYDRFTERVRALPGVEVVATSTSLPTAVRQRTGLTVPGRPTNETSPFALATLVSDDYFSALRIPLREGRLFDTRDREDATASVIISETTARRFWPGGDAVGAQVRLGPDPSSPLLEVIGIVGDVRNDRARPGAEPMVYRSRRQLPAPFATFLVRAQGGDASTLLRAMERELSALDPRVPLQQPTTLAAMLGRGLAGRRLPMLLMTAFGSLALLLASVGVYAMFSSLAATREREFGVRLALGSRPSAIAALVLRQGAGWMVTGLAIGVPGIVLVANLVADMVYGIPRFDPITIGLSMATLVLCATFALLLPLRRATRVDPAVSLRAQ
jgi:putative ABC transport system permease protein